MKENTPSYSAVTSKGAIVMVRTNKYPVPDCILPQNVLVSTSDKSNLGVLVDSVLAANSQAMFYSTGGTGTTLQGIMGSRAATNYMSVEDFTGCPEMEGGLVKTLHPKIHAGLLSERGNPQHEEYLAKDMAKFGKGPGVYFDIFAGNFYEFNEAVKKDGGSAEVARSNIDIGGPCMTMAAAKNWHSVAALSSPGMYQELIGIFMENGGRIPAMYRFQFAVLAMGAVRNFRDDNHDHFVGLDFNRDVLPTITLLP